MALSAKMSGEDYRTYTLLGDGEIQEGQVWEAAMFAGARKLDNLVLIVDNNGLQIDGNIADVCSPYPIDKKFEAFNFHVINIDGNDFKQIAAAFAEARQTKGCLLYTSSLALWPMSVGLLLATMVSPLLTTMVPSFSVL